MLKHAEYIPNLEGETDLNHIYTNGETFVYVCFFLLAVMLGGTHTRGLQHIRD